MYTKMQSTAKASQYHVYCPPHLLCNIMQNLNFLSFALFYENAEFKPPVILQGKA